ncbi:hypothetical protein ACFXB3_21935 [Streptomyces sp. NPDC059447]|uniref:hypothetical protein n=1 Tax=Streptomyces sp. NPDC059447 TaxID=3346834 RepID=UPI00367E8635
MFGAALVVTALVATAPCGPLLWAAGRRAADPADRADFAPALPNHPAKRTSRG